MTNEERERMKWLSERLMEEKDHEKFMSLPNEMLALIERKKVGWSILLNPNPLVPVPF